MVGREDVPCKSYIPSRSKKKGGGVAPGKQGVSNGGYWTASPAIIEHLGLYLCQRYALGSLSGHTSALRICFNISI